MNSVVMAKLPSELGETSLPLQIGRLGEVWGVRAQEGAALCSIFRERYFQSRVCVTVSKERCTQTTGKRVITVTPPVPCLPRPRCIYHIHWTFFCHFCKHLWRPGEKRESGAAYTPTGGPAC